MTNKERKGLSGKKLTYNRFLGRREGGFLGVDQTTGNKKHSVNRIFSAENVWKNYSSEGGAAIETMIGFRRLARFGAKINGIFSFASSVGEHFTVIHAGTNLYRIPTSLLLNSSQNELSPEQFNVCSDMADSYSAAVNAEGKLYIVDGKRYRRLCESGSAVAVTDEQRAADTPESLYSSTESSVYIPTIYSDNQPLEQRNMLTPRFKERFSISINNTIRAGGTADLENYNTYGLKFALKTDQYSSYLEITDVDPSLVSIYIPEYAEFDGNVCPIRSVKGYAPGENGAFAGCSEAVRIVCDAPIYFPSDTFRACNSKLSCIVLRNQYSSIAFDACTADVPLDSLWIRSPSCRFPASVCVDGNGEKIGIRSAKKVFVYVTEGADSVFSNEGEEGGYYTPTNATEIREIRFIDRETVSEETVDNANAFFWYKPTDISAPCGVSSVELLPEDKASVKYSASPVSHCVFRLGSRNYCLKLTDKNGETNIENGIYCLFPLHDICESVTAVTLNGNPRSFKFIKDTNVLQGALKKATDNVQAPYGAVNVRLEDGDDGGVLEIHCVGNDRETAPIEGMTDIFSAYPDIPRDAPLPYDGCTLACTYDGRIFLSGNPDYPGVIFYGTQAKGNTVPTEYFGFHSYERNGIGASEVSALCVSFEGLTAFMNGESGEPSVYVHKPFKSSYSSADTVKKTYATLCPISYPASAGKVFRSCLGAACNFADDTVFLSEYGLDAVITEDISFERTLKHRSTNVDSTLTASLRSGTRPSLSEWQGYLTVTCGDGRMYLADSRRSFTNESLGEREYEWFVLNGIGTYEGEQVAFSPEGGFPVIAAIDGAEHPLSSLFVLHSNGEYRPLKNGAGTPVGIPAVPESSVYYSGLYEYSEESGSYEPITCEGLSTVPYTLDTTGKAFAVHPTCYRLGGSFSPATLTSEIGNLLAFGTANGDICIFNSDIIDSANTYTEQTEGVPPVTLDPYSYNGHQKLSTFATYFDFCELPHRLKRTVPGSLTVHAKSFRHGGFEMKVRTDSCGWRDLGNFTLGGNLNFSDLSTACLSFADECPDHSRAVTVRESERRWLAKQYLFSSYLPFGIYSVAYCYSVY